MDDPRLDTHRALLALATDRQGRLRLVTTNFDVLFEAACPGVRTAAAPTLPVPKPHKWNHLVHLHGKLDENDPEGQNLVLTSADFGVAYLSEGWARRFVVELFHHFSVLFVGYRVDDPIMRYLVDAIAVERRADVRIGRAYAFAEIGDPRKETETKAEWGAKGIVPIIYDKSGNHARLHDTLAAWSDIWSGGLGSKLDLVTRWAPREPAGLPRAEISQLCWAVSDSSRAAQELATLGKEAKLAWLDVFEKHRLLSGGTHPDAELRVALVDRGQETERVPPLDDVRCGIAGWLTAHLDDPALAKWAVNAGGRLHPGLKRRVRERLDSRAGEIPLGLRRVWRALSGSVPLRPVVDDGAWGELCQRLGAEAWSPALRIEVLRALEPCVAIERTWSFSASGLQVRGFAEPERSIAAELPLSCELQIGQLCSTMIDELGRRTDWRSELNDLAFDLSGLLRRALDLHVALGLAAADEDPSYSERPVIEPSDDNRDSRGSPSWTQLIDLVRGAFDALVEQDRERGRTLLRSWLALPYPLFRRLALYAARRTDLIEPAVLLATMKRDAARWIWSVETQIELFRTLRWLLERPRRRGQERSPRTVAARTTVGNVGGRPFAGSVRSL